MIEVILFFSAILLLIAIAVVWPVYDRYQRHRQIWESLQKFPPDRRQRFLDSWQDFNERRK